MKEVVDRLKHKINILLDNHQQLKKEKFILDQRLLELESELSHSKSITEELQEKNQILKLSKSIQIDGKDDSQARKKINQLVREIDKCIALLNE